MADEMDMKNMRPFEIPDEIASNDNKLSTCQQLISRLEPFKSLPMTTRESKKQVWSQFISLWCEILQIPASSAQPCYEECARLLPLLMESSDFLTSRKEIDVARENFFACITQFNQLHIKNYLLLNKEQQELSENQIYYQHVYYLLLIASQTVLFMPFESINDQQFINNHIELFSLLIDRVDKNMPEYTSTVIQNNYSLENLNYGILIFLWNLTDRTVLISILIKCDLPKRVVGWISQADMLTEKHREPLINIAYNIARHDDGTDELNKYDAIQVIKRYQYRRIEKQDSRILIVSMALALLSTPDQLKRDKKGLNNVLNQLLQLVIDASKGNQYRSDGIHVSEPLCVLVKMFVVEERTLDYVLSHAETEPPSDMVSTIQLFISLFLPFSNAIKSTNRLEQFTLIAILNILWSISFQLNYAQELIQNLKFIEQIKTFNEDNSEQEILEQYKPRSMEGIKQAAHGILHNLNIDMNKNDTKLNEQNIVRETKPIENINNKSLIMISYCHDNNAFCTEVLNLLRSRNDAFEIWIDRTHCQEAVDLWESIANGMERASIILCLLSNQYFESKSCRQEFIYAADSLKRRIVPVLIGDFEPKGWLGIRMTGMKYIRFRDLHQLDKNKMTELLNTILSVLSVFLPQERQIEQSPVLNITNSTPLYSPNQRASSKDDINTWFAQHEISTELRDLFNFQSIEEMLDYGELLIKDREKQMNIYTRTFAKKYHGNDLLPHEFNRFANALERLLKEKRPSSIAAKPNSTMSVKSSTCTIL